MNLAQALQELGVQIDVTRVILAVALLLARVLPVIILSPFLGGEVVPTEVKIGLGVTLAAVMFPAIESQVMNIPLGALPFIMVMLKELFIGLALSFVVNLVFDAAWVAGTLVDTLGGTAMAQLMVPQIQQQVSLFSSLKLQLSVVLFLTLNGHHAVIQALADSLSLVPLDRFPAFSGGVWPLFELMIRVSANLFMVGLALAAPVLLATFLTDLGLGMINRVAPQIQVFFISMSIKPLVAVLMTLVALHLILDRMHLEFEVMLRMVREALRHLA